MKEEYYNKLPENFRNIIDTLPEDKKDDVMDVYFSLAQEGEYLTKSEFAILAQIEIGNISGSDARKYYNEYVNGAVKGLNKLKGNGEYEGKSKL